MTDEVPPQRRHFCGTSAWMAFAMQALAGLLGACGVAVAAAGAHRGGGHLTDTASTFMLIHAVAVLAITFHWLDSRLRGAEWLVTAAAMLLGCALFSGDLALSGLAGLRPWPSAAPIGGTLMLAGWVLAVVATIRSALRWRQASRSEARNGPF
jgi:uncharacterized membrane protein YgdD (TMEM256/DUF423 family)